MKRQAADQRMTVVEGGAKRERLQHVAFKIDVACEIGLGDVALIERAQRLERALVAKAYAKLPPCPDPILRFSPLGSSIEKGVENPLKRLTKESSVAAADDIPAVPEFACSD